MNDIESAVARLEANQQNNSKRLDEHDEKIQKLEDTYALIKNVNYRIEKVESNVEKIDTKLDEKLGKIDKKLEESNKEKAEKKDKFIDYIFYSAIGILLAFISAKIGLS